MAALMNQMSAIEALRSLFDGQQNCDVKFRVGSTTVGAHKTFLQARSPVLGERTKDWTEAKLPIVLNEVNDEVFKNVLRYIYSDEINITDGNVFELFHTAKVLRLGHLEGLCAKHVLSRINAESVCNFVTQAVEFDAVNLQEKCSSTFGRFTKEVLAKPEFLDLPQKAISALLDCTETNVLEIDLFLAVKNWMKAECKRQGLPDSGENMRRVIGDALYKIRFPTMTMLDFSNEVTCIEGLLSDSEMLQTYRKLSVLKNGALPCPFSAQQRVKSITRDNIMSHQRNLSTSNLLSSFGVQKETSQTPNPGFNLQRQRSQTPAPHPVPTVKMNTIASAFASAIEGHDINLKALKILLQACNDLFYTPNSIDAREFQKLPQTTKQECQKLLNEWQYAICCENSSIAHSKLKEFYAVLETV